jgi:hypothetical protein
MMLYAYFGGLSADKQLIYEVLLEQRGQQYIVSAVMRPRQVAQDTAPRHPLWRWLRATAFATGTRQLYNGRQARLALRTLFGAACAANLATHGQRFCYVLPSAPMQAGALAPIIPAQLRADDSLPLHPQLWQAGRSLATLPRERHHQACLDARYGMQLTIGGRSLDEGYYR